MSNQEDITKIKLNQDQQDTIQKLDDFLASENMFFRLDGSAGTGKSTTLAIWAQRVLKAGRTIALSAPTNKATRNVRTFANKIDPKADIRCGTVYSLLGLVLGKDGAVREIETTDTHKMGGVDVLAIDESSMINDDLMTKLHEHAIEHNVKMVFMGDPKYQLPPVKEEESAVMKLFCNAELTKVERHDNQILNFATHIRDCIDRGTMPTIKGDYDTDGGVIVLKSKDFYAQMKKAFSSDVYDEYPDAFKTLAWRNVIVDSYNDSIREAMYNDNPARPFEIGERIVSKAPVVDVHAWITERKESFQASTDEEGTVRSCTRMDHPVFGEIEVYNVVYLSELGEVVNAYMPTSKGQRDYDERLNKLSAAARKDRFQWPAFWQFKGLFADLAPCHALTGHRAQGSTYRTAFVDLLDVCENRNLKERLRMMYTMSTRPSKSLIIRA